jgi:hypothetical protein
MSHCGDGTSCALSIDMAKLSSLVVAALALALAACGPSSGEDLLESLDPAGGKADGSGFPVLDAELGESLLDLVVSPAPAGAREIDELRDAIVVIRLELAAGDAVVATMRADAPSLDAYLLVKGPSKETLDSQDDQALLPMGLESDAVVAFTARQSGPHFLFATGGHDMETGGRFRVDLIQLSSPPVADLGLTNPRLRAYAGELRRREPEVQSYLAQSVLVEQADGMLGLDLERAKALPLSEYSAVRQLQSGVNSLRSDYFAFFDETVDRAAVGRQVAEVWAAARQ